MRKPLVVSLALALLTLLGLHLSGCVTETVEVTRVKIMERHVIERVPITVEVTRIQRVVETPRPSPIDVLPPDDTETPQASSETPSASPTPTRPSPTPGTPAPTEPSANQSGRAILAALQNVEQTLLVLVGALNSEPPPVDQTIELYDSLRDAPRVDVPEAETELSSINDRYREQIDNTLNQANDLYTHLVQIQSGQATQTEISPIQLGLARDAASSATSTIQGLMRELEAILAALQ